MLSQVGGADVERPLLMIEDISRPNNGRSQKFTRGFGDANDRFF